MKTKNIILIIIIAVIALGIGLFSRQQNISNPSLVKNGHHDIWYCPMHPFYTSDKPGICPICYMDLVKRLGNPKAELQQQIAGSKQSNAAAQGYVTISVPEQKQQLIGVRIAVVTKKTVVKTIRAAGQYEGEVYAQVFEVDLEFIKVGQKAIVEVPAYHQKYEGEVLSIDSSVDEASRTTRVRIWLKNVNRKHLKSNMFVNVELPVILKEAIIVPRDAVMDTGVRKVVFVQKDAGTFEPRDIKTGWETDDGYEVISGLKEGERIVVSGNFLLDSESRVQAGLEEASQADTTTAAGGDSHGQ